MCRRYHKDADELVQTIHERIGGYGYAASQESAPAPYRQLYNRKVLY